MTKSVTMPALLACFIGAISVAAAQDAPHRTAVHASQGKKQARLAAQAKPRQPTDAARWMDRASEQSSGGGGGGY